MSLHNKPEGRGQIQGKKKRHGMPLSFFYSYYSMFSTHPVIESFLPLNSFMQFHAVPCSFKHNHLCSRTSLVLVLIDVLHVCTKTVLSKTVLSIHLKKV